MLGICYYLGKGVLKDLKKAKEWISKAYENGDPGAKKFWEKYELWKY